MAENKNAKTPADGPEYERGFVEGMQRQMQLHVNRVIREEPTAWRCQCGRPYTVTCISSKPAKQEPVAFCNGMPAYEGSLSKAQRLTQDLEAPLTINGVPLYPKKEWVGLTAYEIQEIHSGNQHWGSFACAIEAKLREKNQ